MAPTTPRVVPLRLPNRELADAIARTWAAGNAVLPLPPEASEAVIERFGGAVERSVAAVVLTSGSTGEPRAVELGWDALESSAEASNRRLAVTGGDRWLCPVPMHHIAGLQMLVRSRIARLEAPVVLDRFDAQAVGAAEANLVSLVPTMMARLLDAGEDLSRFKAVLLGGAAAPRALLQRAAHAGARVVRTYGMTETCGGCVYEGEALEGVACRIAPTGEVELSGPMLFRRYRAMPELTARRLRDGWFRTADSGRLENERLRILGRLDDIINTGGEKVAPAEVAGLLMEYPGIVHAEVIGASDLEWGERVVAFIEPAGAPPSLEEVRSFVARRAAPFKAPRQLVVVGEWPRLPSGKVDQRALERQL